jgi:hypothetical protein
MKDLIWRYVWEFGGLGGVGTGRYLGFRCGGLGNGGVGNGVQVWGGKRMFITPSHLWHLLFL